MRGGPRLIDRAPPPADLGRDDGSGGGWAWLLTVRGIVEAELVRGLLETAGVAPVLLDATDQSPTSWMFLAGDVNALVRVYVPRSRLEDARLALLEAEGSSDEVVPPPARRTASRLVWLVIAVLIVAVFGWRLLVTACGSQPC